MNLHVFNTGHGFCAYLVADNNNVMLFDCGHDDEVGFRPSKRLPALDCNGIETLVVTNYDEDHVSDLANLRQALSIQVLRRNRSITLEQLEKLKLEGGPLGPGMKALLAMMERYRCDCVTPPEYTGLEFKFFCNSYPTFTDTNNLSLVAFIHCAGCSIIIPGDLGQLGWKELLKNPDFVENLKRVNVFVASHHGRESGYLPDVFRFCKPDVIIVSDEKIKFDTQEVDYAKHASGIRDRETGGTHYVLTTRKHGDLVIQSSGGEWLVHRAY